MMGVGKGSNATEVDDMSRSPRPWQWLIIIVGFLIIVGAAGRWAYQRFSVSRQPPPPATPAEVEKEYREKVLGYP